MLLHHRTIFLIKIANFMKHFCMKFLEEKRFQNFCNLLVFGIDLNLCKLDFFLASILLATRKELLTSTSA